MDLFNGKKNLIITGERGAGKSTYAKELCLSFNCRIFGFCTLTSGRDESGRHRVYIFPAEEAVKKSRDELLEEADKSRLVGSSDSVTKELFPEVFDSLGCEYLKHRNNPEEDKIILMDEIGFMEDDAHEFCSEILKCLDSDIPVIAVLKKKCRSRIKQQILSRDDITLIELPALK